MRVDKRVLPLEQSFTGIAYQLQAASIERRADFMTDLRERAFALQAPGALTFDRGPRERSFPGCGECHAPAQCCRYAKTAKARFLFRIREFTGRTATIV
jgi:hypothetical protein